MGYLPEMWRDFGVTVGGLAGALTGLLFVAVSIKSEVLARRARAASRCYAWPRPVALAVPAPEGLECSRGRM